MSDEAPWLATAWAELTEASRTGPLVDADAWDAGVASLTAKYSAAATSSDPLVARHARDQRETLAAYANRIAARARDGNGRVPYRVREADWSGRLHLFDPLWQSVTKDGDLVLRKAVVAPPGHRIVRADWHASQLYLLAGLSGDPQLGVDLGAGDIYRELGGSLAPSHPRARDLGKLLVLAITYRAGVRTLVAKALEKGIRLSDDQVRTLLEQLRQRYSALWTWGNAIQAVGRCLLWTPAGRRVQLRPDPDQARRNPGASTPPGLPTLLAGIAQAWEADALLGSLAALAPQTADLGLRLTLHLHDCTLWEVRVDTADSAARRVAEVMTAIHARVQRWAPRSGASPVKRAGTPRIGAPVDVALGPSWGG